MHIAIVSGEYPPRWGGIGSVVFHLAGHFVQLGHEVTIITRSHSDKVPSQEGVNVIPVRWARLPMAFTRSYGKSAFRALKKLNSTKPIDVINTLQFHAKTAEVMSFLNSLIRLILSSTPNSSDESAGGLAIKS